MSYATPSAPIAERELTLTRFIPAAPEALYAAWTEPALLKQWFCPKPWGVSDAVLDVRTGGASHVTMVGPAGEVVPDRSVYLEVIPNRKIVFTDAFVSAWEPSGKAFITATITFDPEGAGTRYHCRVTHWNVDDVRAQEAMGFHAGWGLATDQLVELVTRR